MKINNLIILTNYYFFILKYVLIFVSTKTNNMKTIIKKLSIEDAFYNEKHLFEGKEMRQNDNGFWVFINEEDKEKARKENFYSVDGYYFYMSSGFKIKQL